jgi:hypothetical protein
MPKQPRHRPVRKFENAKRVIIECDIDECPRCGEHQWDEDELAAESPHACDVCDWRWTEGNKDAMPEPPEQEYPAVGV